MLRIDLSELLHQRFTHRECVCLCANEPMRVCEWDGERFTKTFVRFVDGVEDVEDVVVVDS